MGLVRAGVDRSRVAAGRPKTRILRTPAFELKKPQRLLGVGAPMRAHQIMTAEVITVGADASIIEAINTMLRHHISGLPVIDAAGKLIGIVSEGDFIRRAEIGTQRKRGRWLTFLVGKDQVAADFVHEQGRKIGEIMTPAPLTVTEDTPLDQIVQIMQSNNVKRLPVVRENQLVGIVTRSDFLAALADLARNVPSPSADDDHIRSGVIAAIEQAVRRPCRLNVVVREGAVSLSGVIKSDTARRATVRRCGKRSRRQEGTGLLLCLPAPGRRSWRRRLCFFAGAALNHGRRAALTAPMEQTRCALSHCIFLLDLRFSDALKRLSHRTSKMAGDCRNGGAPSATPSDLTQANQEERHPLHPSRPRTRSTRR